MYNRAGTGIARRYALWFPLAAVLLLAGCRTVPPPAPQFMIPAPSGALLIASAESGIVAPPFDGALKLVLGEDLFAVLDRAEQVSFALLPGGGAGLLLEGRYPQGMTSLGLSLSREWRRLPGDPVRWRLAAGGAEIAPLGDGILAVGLPAADPIISAAAEREAAGIPRDGEFLLLIPAVERLAAAVPIAGSCRVIARRDGERLKATMEWEFATPARARTSIPLIKLALWGLMKDVEPDFSRSDIETVVDERRVVIEGLNVGAAGFSAILGRVLKGPERDKELK